MSQPLTSTSTCRRQISLLSTAVLLATFTLGFGASTPAQAASVAPIELGNSLDVRGSGRGLDRQHRHRTDDRGPGQRRGAGGGRSRDRLPAG